MPRRYKRSLIARTRLDLLDLPSNFRRAIAALAFASIGFALPRTIGTFNRPFATTVFIMARDGKVSFVDLDDKPFAVVRHAAFKFAVAFEATALALHIPFAAFAKRGLALVGFEIPFAVSVHAAASGNAARVIVDLGARSFLIAMGIEGHLSTSQALEGSVDRAFGVAHDAAIVRSSKAADLLREGYGDVLGIITIAQLTRG